MQAEFERLRGEMEKRVVDSGKINEIHNQDISFDAAEAHPEEEHINQEEQKHTEEEKLMFEDPAISGLEEKDPAISGVEFTDPAILQADILNDPAIQSAQSLTDDPAIFYDPAIQGVEGVEASDHHAKATKQGTPVDINALFSGSLKKH